MTQPPRGRPWIQLHLSTCIVLMLAAGGFFWANMIGTHLVGWSVMEQQEVCASYRFGWPLTYLDGGYRYGSNQIERPQERLAILGDRYPYKVAEGTLDFGSLILNVTFAALFLLIATLFCEWRIRRRADDEAEFRESIG